MIKLVAQNYIKLWLAGNFILFLLLFFIDEKVLIDVSLFDSLPVSIFAVNNSDIPGFAKNFIGMQFLFGLVYIFIGPIYKQQYFKMKKTNKVVYGGQFFFIILALSSLVVFFGYSFLMLELNIGELQKNIIGYFFIQSLDYYGGIFVVYSLFYIVMALGFNISVYILRK